MTASTPQSCKSKGRSFQQFVARELQTVTGLSESDIGSRGMGGQGIDIMLSARARQKIPFAIECKRAETWTCPNWWRQTVTNAELEHLHPALIFKENRRRAYVMMVSTTFHMLADIDTELKIEWTDMVKLSYVWRMKSWISEAERTAGMNRSPRLIIMCRDSLPITVIRFSDFCYLIRQWSQWTDIHGSEGV